MKTNYFNGFEKVINRQYIFTIIVLIQALFGSKGLIHTPSRLDKVLSSRTARFLALTMIAYTATQELEVAAIGVAVLLGVLYLLRTKKEREQHGIL